MMITKSSMLSHTWSLKNTSIDIDYHQYAHKPIAVLAGVS